MSAYLVSAAHIDLLVSGARQFFDQGRTSFYTMPGLVRSEFYRGASDEEAADGVFNVDTLGRALWAENLRSINARYPDSVDDPSATPGDGSDLADVLAYTYGPGFRVVDVDPLGLLGAIRAYRYQACETGEAYYRSVAEAFCSALESAVIDWLIDRTGANAWSVDDLASVEGDTVASPADDGGWSIRFRPGSSAAVSISDMIGRRR